MSLKVAIAKIITASAFFVSVFLKSGNKCTTAAASSRGCHKTCTCT